MNNLRIAIMSSDRQRLHEIQEALRGISTDLQVTVIDGGLRQEAEQAARLAADVLVVACGGEDVAELEALAPLAERHPGMAVIVACERQSPEFLLQAIRLGVREVLGLPLQPEALRMALARIRERATPTVRSQGKVLAFTACKGGSGATFLASNLAYVLSAHGEARVALIDLNLQFGDLHMFLGDREPQHTLSDVVRGIHRLDAGLLKSSMLSLGPQLSVLAAPSDPSHGLEARPEHVDALLAVARQQFDYVILDVGRTVDAASVRALDHADLIHAVLQANLPFVRGARRMLDVFQSLEYPEHKVEVVVNRYEKNSDLDIKNIEGALGRRVRRTIPNDYDAVAASVNQGVPVARLARSSPVSGALMQWCEQLQGRPVRDGGGWIARVLKRA